MYGAWELLNGEMGYQGYKKVGSEREGKRNRAGQVMKRRESIRRNKKRIEREYI
jgi:hypothetical protein